jgi:hypothetical protein
VQRASVRNRDKTSSLDGSSLIDPKLVFQIRKFHIFRRSKGSDSTVKTIRSRRKAAVTPVIATIILIAATIVFSLVVGSYAFSVFSSNTKGIKLVTAVLTSGTATSPTSEGVANFALSIRNDGTSRFVKSIVLSGGGLTSAPTVYQCATSTSCSVLSSPSVPAGSVSNFLGTGAFYIGVVLTGGAVYSYQINFDDGETITGLLTAQ